MIKAAIVGLGKMGLSHQAIVNAHPEVDLVGVCDTSSYLLGVLKKYTGVPTFTNATTMLQEAKPDAVIIATPSRLHAPMVEQALLRDVHVFCEKPFVLDDATGGGLAELAAERGVVTQVGYHNRFVGSFREVNRLLQANMLGKVTHVLAEAYGPVVLRPKGSTWRSQKSEGGGCLYDYAAHPINLVNWYLGEPRDVRGTVLNSVFSREIDDEVTGTLRYGQGTSAQISVSWSDESVRKMTTRLTLWGTAGKVYVDRQEMHVYLREDAQLLDGYQPGWNVRYTTDLTDPVGYYLRGEEYSAQLDHFFERVAAGKLDGENTFASAVVTDRTMAMMIRDAADERAAPVLLTTDAATTPDGVRNGHAGGIVQRIGKQIGTRLGSPRPARGARSTTGRHA